MKKYLNLRHGILYTVIMALILVASVFAIIEYTYSHTESEAYERLRLESAKYKNNINIQLMSDRETLTSMAILIESNYHDIEGYTKACKSFKPFGLCEDVGILIPGDILVTKHGPTDVSGELSFEEEAARGAYISGRTLDATKDGRLIMRSAVPVVHSDGRTEAVLYGAINIDKFTEYYRDQLSGDKTYMCILEGGSGDFIIDTKNPEFISANLANLAGVSYGRGYTYGKLSEDISNGESGYTSFVEKDGKEYLYVRYAALNIEDWRILIGQTESVVFADTKKTLWFFVTASCWICFIFFMYLLGVMYSDRKKGKRHKVASDIRKSLLEINQRDESLTEALQMLTEFAGSRSAFIVDSYNEEHHYMRPEKIDEILKPDEIEYFNETLLLYASRHRNVHGADVYGAIIEPDRAMREEMSEFCDFMVNHNINKVYYNVVINNNVNIYVLGVINPANNDAIELMNTTAVCFSMAVYNKKHLERTRKMAITDSLTGIENRVAYAAHISANNFLGKKIACIYVDVNELHYYNNKYGHAAGDQMLRFIAGTIKKKFSDSAVFRMGGDEFLIINDTLSENDLKECLENVITEVNEMKYRIAVGMSIEVVKGSVEDVVNKAEQDMYINKAHYYQDKELKKVKSITKKNDIYVETGVEELDACLSVMSLRYYGIYVVSLEKDTCVRILAPKYLEDMNEESVPFSLTMKRYVHEFVKHEFHRNFYSFLEYDALIKELESGDVPSICYERIDGEKILLKIYPITTSDESDCIWVFEKAE